MTRLNSGSEALMMVSTCCALAIVYTYDTGIHICGSQYHSKYEVLCSSVKLCPFQPSPMSSCKIPP